ncbi:CBS domain-containing protein [Desulfonema limicola]|uniref:CBS domain-containing protein n=1 Tax=Desulfonema limicola TaxID=45656 RepID=A0A975BCY4_9BACT|nr:CBS domain-containing protein [Desulfonema limicola]QTA82900.1 CBS domain-containing protein [Desulfonema limicola]
MKVNSLMISNPITITENASIREAISLMKANSIRHLPVISGINTLEGLITFSDLKEGLLPSMLSDVSLKDLIIKAPICVTPDDDIETAARLIYNHKISGLPVVHKDKLAGIITETDILRTFIDMMGILTSDSRLEVIINDTPETFKKAVHIIQNNGGDIINVSMTAKEASHRIYYFRLFPCQTESIKKALKAQNFDVISD